MSATAYYYLNLLPLVVGLPALTFSILRMFSDFSKDRRIINHRSFRASIERTVASSGIVILVFSQISFAPVQPHLGSNLVRVFIESSMMLAIIIVCALDMGGTPLHDRHLENQQKEEEKI